MSRNWIAASYTPTGAVGKLAAHTEPMRCTEYGGTVTRRANTIEYAQTTIDYSARDRDRFETTFTLVEQRSALCR